MDREIHRLKRYRLVDNRQRGSQGYLYHAATREIKPPTIPGFGPMPPERILAAPGPLGINGTCVFLADL